MSIDQRDTDSTPYILKMPPEEPSKGPWPPSNGLTTPIVPRSSAILSVYGSAHIAAPASLVWQVLRDTSGYPRWNTFVPRVTIHSQPQSADKSEKDKHLLRKDTSFTFHVVMDSSKPSKVTDIRARVTDVSTPEEPSDYVHQTLADRQDEEKTYTLDLRKVYRISWTTEGGFIARGLKCERFHEIIDLGEEGCEVRTWENQGGLLAYAVNYLYKDLFMRKFPEWCTELKVEAERLSEG
ncbi:hypothetical protein G7Y79_00056g090110 [Physcia stellaris]|nr:hypothetical protein G7Y79_00056g090110 [Physcia stellaris]